MSKIKNMRFFARSLEEAYKVIFRTKFPILMCPYHSFNPNYHGVVVDGISELKKHFSNVQSRSAINTVVIDKIQE